MGDVVSLNAPSATERERQRFEKWAASGLRRDESAAVFTRSRGGDYVLAATRAAWAAWLARGLTDFGDGAGCPKCDGMLQLVCVACAIRGDGA